MFIQCQHCQTTYKIDEHKIPDKESVVRCAKCSELIPLNRERQHELLKKSPKKIVECNSCGTQYSVPLSTIKHESTKVKCGKCGNLFTISKSGESNLNEDSSSAHAYEEEFNTDDIDLDNIDIPSESEIEVDDLFGDVADFEQKGTGKAKSKNATEDYFESVKLTKEDDQELVDEDIGINQISEDQKYKIFLKPKKGKGKAEEFGESWPGEESLETDKPGKFGKAKGIKKATKPAKKPARKKSDSPNKRKHILLWVIWGLVVLALVVLAWIIMDVKTKEVYTPPQTETYNNQSKIAILEPLNGRFLKRNQTPERIFVLEGKLLNVYGGEVTLSMIEIEGYLYIQDSEQPITANAFAGVTLSDEQLKEWNKEDIESALLSQSQKSDSLKEFGADDLIDFQTVFFNAPEPQKVRQLGAKIKKFNRRKN